MIASVSSAVSAVLSRSGRAASTATGWHFVRVPDLNTATHRLIGKAKAGWTFETICRLLHLVGRVGTKAAKRAAQADQSLGLGLAAIAAESGQSLGKVRRDCAALAELGLIVLTHPNVLMIRDAEGRLTENRTGRSKATVIHLTITEDHLRQGAVSRTRMAGLPAADSVHPGRAIQREEKTERTPDGGADGVGTPPAAEAGLTAGEAPASILPVNAGRDAPDVPAGRILPSPRPQAAATGRRRSDFTEDHAGPQTFTGEAADAFERTRRRLEAERRQREAQDAAGEAPAPQAARHDPPQAAPPPPRRPVPPAAFDHAAAQAAVLAALAVT